MMMKKIPTFLLRSGGIAALVWLAGCAAVVRTPYTRPEVTVPAQWTQADAAIERASLDAWWKNFGDAELDRVIDAVLASNNNLAAATIRVRRAQLQAGLAENQLVPSINAGVSSNANRNLRGDSETSRSNSASVSVSYEVDLWGRLGSQRDAAAWEAQATAEDRESTRLSLIGTTAGLYWQIAYLNQRVTASLTSIEYAKQTLELVRVQNRAGAVSSLEVNDAEQNLLSQQAAHAQLLQQRSEARNAFAILFDAPPNMLEAGPKQLPSNELPGIAPGLPAELLARRPDLRAVELRLRETLAGVDATRASYYPSFSLTAGVGSSSTSLTDVLKNPVASLGAGLSLPFLQFNQMRMNIAVSETQYEEAVVNFRQTLYQAFADTANALAARETLTQRFILLQGSLEATRKAERLYEVRYRAGAVALRSWLDAQERRRSAEIALAESQLGRLNNQVTVYQVLGGDAQLPVGASL
jgi:NodT family efflux transporter outer membrane factor (OMF) lipoprotein